MPAPVRPLSPHLQIYRWQISNTLSILHRITGSALAAGLIALAYWLVSLAEGPAAYGTAMQVFWSPLGIVFLIGWTFSFLYHLLNGIRHLFWDAGYGFERPHRHVSGWLVVAGSVVSTCGVVFAVWHGAHA